MFDDFSAAIKKFLPNAQIAWDISPWLTQSQMRQWWGFFQGNPNINYLFTSGGKAQANSQFIHPFFSNEQVTYSFMSQLTGKKIICDTGYGVAGASTGHQPLWDNSGNLIARIKEGVFGITQQNAQNNWGTLVLNLLRPKLPSIC